jgi:hypothetical protein
MANRTNTTDVKQILDTNLDGSVIKAFIDTANTIVGDTLGSDTTLSATQLKEIEKWLAAHLIAATRQRQGSAEKVGDASITYQGKTGMGLNSTMYGQQVLMLDSTGKMAQKLGKKSATITAIESFD